MSCPFCSRDKLDIVCESPYFFAILDRAPVTEGHVLIISKNHRATQEDLKSSEQFDLPFFRDEVFKFIRNKQKVDGFNTFVNSGVAAGQTVMHFHEHVVPRRSGDVENPRGGARNFMIPLVPLWPSDAGPK
jgi:diadenosine tetraphosphate (Ap4A) HIT family hydrolase